VLDTKCRLLPLLALSVAGAACGAHPDADPLQKQDGPASSTSRPLAIGRDEVLRRLSQLLFQGPPDAELRTTASAMDLSTSEGVAALARAMLRDPRAVRGIEAFVKHWLVLDDLPSATKDPTLYPGWSPALAQDMVDEVRRFVAHVVLEGDGRLETLLTAPLAFVNERLAAVYGFDGALGPELRAVEHDGKNRLGVLGLPGVIAGRSRTARTFPSRRGNYASGRFACRPIFISNLVDLPAENHTMRQAQDEGTKSAFCQGCHHIMNPPGWAFERFDAIGALRATDAGLPIDSSGQLPRDILDSDAEVPFDGLPDLARALAKSPRAPACHAYFWLTFAVPSLVPGDLFESATVVDEPDSVPGLAEIIAQFDASGHDIPALIAAVVASEPFLAP
jgi:hypothetical protein